MLLRHIISPQFDETIMFDPNTILLKPVLTPPLPIKSPETSMDLVDTGPSLGSIGAPLGRALDTGRGAVLSILRFMSSNRLVPRYLVFIQLSQKVKKRP